ncbi:putative odorant receptor 85d [Rhynchophorus ferrugineus]|uniref:putative odorant receptor 85d n=1 Tax=Rhynchophorus ferrugineus TaxID=354439 RepID=UPI003FCC8485
MEILAFNIKVLKCLFFWPLDTLSPLQNNIIQFLSYLISTCGGFCTSTPFLHQVFNGIDDASIFGESLIHFINYWGFAYVFYCNIQSRESTKKLIKDFDVFKAFCDESISRNVESKITRYAKGLLLYGTTGITFNALWPIITKESCLSTRSESYQKHDPCGLPTHHWIPINSNRIGVYLLIYTVDNFAIVTGIMGFVFLPMTIGGFILHIMSQLDNFKYVFANVINKCEDQKDEKIIEAGLRQCVLYHQSILWYATRVFDTFSHMLIVYILMASFTMAALTYQIIILNDKLEDKIRFFILLLGWIAMFFMICLSGQEITDKSRSVSEAIYNSNWYNLPVRLRKYVLIIMLRTIKPLRLKAEWVGIFTLPLSVNVFKTAYSFFTLLLTMTGPDE